MSERIWLASYPKSGNTWLRILIGCLSLKDGEALDINKLPERGGIASARAPFDNLTLIDSGLLTHDEIDRLRPRIYEELGQSLEEEVPEGPQEPVQVRFVKVHDAYTLTSLGEPLLAGKRGAKAAILIVRDPRDVVPSLANHNGTTIDEAIEFMNNADAGFCNKPGRQHSQLRQQLPSWSGHIASWLDQRDIPIHLLRYEDLKRDTAGALLAVLDFAGVPATPADIERSTLIATFEALKKQERNTGFSEWHDRSGNGRLFFRRGDVGGWRDELTTEQILRIESAHGPMMKRLGYELWTSSELVLIG